MCGIIGYVGHRQANGILVEALKRLEYRGYDSCGLAFLNNGTAQVVRAAGRITALEEKLRSPVLGKNISGAAAGVHCGVGHTRWATHGKPSESNAHPHGDCSGQIFVVHNGIIENYQELRQQLLAAGHRFRSETDTEVLPHLIESHFQGNLEEALRAALKQVKGVYAVAAICSRDGGKLVAARRGAPLVIGIGQGENFVASDAPALLPHTQEMLFLNDGELIVVHPKLVLLQDLQGRRIVASPQRVSWTAAMAEKEGYPHFMLKEIFEQPRAVQNALCGRVGQDTVLDLESEITCLEALRSAARLCLIACGTSLHSALVGKFLIESLARLPVEVDYASEFRYRGPLVERSCLVLAISQSGETADTLGAAEEAHRRGAPVLSICNVVGSSLARNSDGVLYTHAGPEMGVASTKAFTTQIVVLYLLALLLARQRQKLSDEEIRRHLLQLKAIPGKMEKIFEQNDQIRRLAEQFCSYRNFLYLGRGINYPIALEGALKLKEISYIHAEGYPAGEMKHGPIALIDPQMATVVLAPQDAVYAKTVSNLQEVKVRDGVVLAVATQGDAEMGRKADFVIFLPRAEPQINPVLATVVLQLFAYHVAAFRGCDIDKPRNLAKSVTVE